MNITQAFNLINYLRNETDYLPWMSVTKNVGYILSILPPNSNIHHQLKVSEETLLRQIPSDAALLSWSLASKICVVFSFLISL